MTSSPAGAAGPGATANVALRLIALIAAAVIAGVFLFVPPIAQDPAYHAFADQRSWLGVPHAGDVLSNIAFAAVGLWGLWLVRTSSTAYALFFAGVALTALGSAYYHWAPSDERLAWDRLPMTIAFMALFAVFISDRVSPRAGRLWLWPLLGIGLASVLYWKATGDLRPYALVQFLPILVAILMCTTQPSLGGLPARTLGSLLVLYGLAKLFEAGDRDIWEITGGAVSGHSLKHLAAAAACAAVALLVSRPLKRP